jgi:arabinogalactan oligomer/maltooligosaccharide transport system permease protein
MVKILLLGIFSSVLGFMAFMALLGGEWLITLVLIVVIILGNYVYLSKKPVAAKFFYPGTIFLVIFLVVPIGYTGFMSTQLFKTGNLISKEEAVTQLNAVGLTPAESGVTYDMVVGRYEGNLAVLLTNQLDGTVSLGFRNELRTLSESAYELGELGYAQTADGFLAIDLANDPNAEQILNDIKIPVGNDVFIASQGFDFAAEMIETYRYDSATNTWNVPSESF